MLNYARRDWSLQDSHADVDFASHHSHPGISLALGAHRPLVRSRNATIHPGRVVGVEMSRNRFSR